MATEMISNQTLALMKQFDGAPPKGVQINEYFDIKIQLCLEKRSIAQEPTLNPHSDYLLYNKERDLLVYVSDRNCKQRPELFRIISTFPAFKGQKGYFRAKVNEGLANQHGAAQVLMPTATVTLIWHPLAAATKPHAFCS